MESRLYRIHRRNGTELNELNELNINDMIRMLVDNENLLRLQKTYQSRALLKEDLKAISAFRNIIVHTNRKLLKEIDSKTIIQRKKQITQMLETLQQISDNINRGEAE